MFKVVKFKRLSQKNAIKRQTSHNKNMYFVHLTANYVNILQNIQITIICSNKVIIFYHAVQKNKDNMHH
jgi:hypothetical protein